MESTTGLAEPAGRRAPAGSSTSVAVRAQWHGTHAHRVTHPRTRYQASPHRHYFTARLIVDYDETIDISALQEELWLYCLDHWSHTVGRVGLDEMATAIALWARGRGRSAVQVELDDGDVGIRVG